MFKFRKLFFMAVFLVAANLGAVTVTADSATETTTEAGGTATITVTLSNAPTVGEDVTITATGLDATEGSLNTTTLVFTNADPGPKDFVITGVNDDVDDGDIVYNLTLTASLAGADTQGYGGLTDIVAVTNTDNDTAGVTLSKSTLTTTEPLTTDSFTVVLDSEPTNDVTVTLTGLDSTEGSLNTDSLTFTSVNWGNAQTITVTGKNDPYDDGDITYTLTLAHTSSDSKYNVLANDTVSVTNSDNNGPGAGLEPAGSSSGGGSSATDTSTNGNQSEGTPPNLVEDPNNAGGCSQSSSAGLNTSALFLLLVAGLYGVFRKRANLNNLFFKINQES